jgi:hypothetical protein
MRGQAQLGFSMMKLGLSDSLARREKSRVGQASSGNLDVSDYQMEWRGKQV